MTPITVTLAAYQSLAAARADWDAFELAAKSGSCELVDGAARRRAGLPHRDRPRHRVYATGAHPGPAFC